MPVKFLILAEALNYFEQFDSNEGVIRVIRQ